MEEPSWFKPDETMEEVLDLVAARFSDHFGDLRPFGYATTRAQALEALAFFVRHALPRFGDYQDAMLSDHAFLYHAALSPYINIGLLDPLEVCRAAQAAWEDGDVPNNAAEGFIRQIIGWREFVRGSYFLEGPDYAERNRLRHDRDLPDFFWGAETKMNCLSRTVTQSMSTPLNGSRRQTSSG